MLVIYAIALPSYVATEVITRGLIALRDTRTPLITNTLQLDSGAILSLFVAHVGVQIIPLAFAVTSTVETLILGTMLLLKLRARQGAGSLSGPPENLSKGIEVLSRT